MKEASLYTRSGDRVRCLLCWRTCEIGHGERGFCGVRLNLEGRLYTLTYGNLSAIESRPMEVKPFFHFKPGRSVLTFSTYSCNLECPWCQNWHISKRSPPSRFREISPERLIEMVDRDIGLCASFNEPTLLFEFLLDAFPLAKERGLVNTMVSNGYMTIRALRELGRVGLDAINIDIKGDEEVYERFCGGRARFVWATASEALRLGIHLEMVNLLVTGVSDREESIRDVVENHLRHLGPEVPLHFTRYFSAYKFEARPTSLEVLNRAVEIARREGLKYVYVGNVPGHRNENTFCPRCGALLIRRRSWVVLENRISEGKCPECGEEIYGVW